MRGILCVFLDAGAVADRTPPVVAPSSSCIPLIPVPAPPVSSAIDTRVSMCIVRARRYCIHIGRVHLQLTLVHLVCTRLRTSLHPTLGSTKGSQRRARKGERRQRGECRYLPSRSDSPIHPHPSHAPIPDQHCHSRAHPGSRNPFQSAVPSSRSSVLSPLEREVFPRLVSALRVHPSSSRPHSSCIQILLPLTSMPGFVLTPCFSSFECPGFPASVQDCDIVDVPVVCSPA